MKRLFGHSGKKAQKREGRIERTYDWDLDSGDEEDSGEDFGERERWEEEESYDEDSYEEEESYDEDSYEEEGFYDEDFYGEEPDDEDDYGDEDSYEKNPNRDWYYQEDEDSYEEVLYDEKEARSVKRRKGQGGEDSAGIRKGFRGMDVMDKVMAVTGAGVLILAVITASVFIRGSIADRQVSEFVDVGVQLSGISMIGERGLLAVAEAKRAKEADVPEPSEPSETSQPPEEDQKPEYEETGYERQVAVRPDFTSIQKDLKIKFINRKTGKLVPNVPFSVTVTDSGNKSVIWSDDDMDGIIYKKNLEAGTYKVAMEALADGQYQGYSLSLEAQSVEVKKEIVYKKVDVANEVKQESEVDVKKEDTKKVETVAESSLQDTVGWVESKILSDTYEAVDKSGIPDPMTLAMGKGLLWTSEEKPSASPDLSASVSPSPSVSSPASASPSPSASVSPSPSASVSPSPSASVSPGPSASVSPSPSASASPSPSPSPSSGLAPVTVKVEQADLTGAIGGTLAAVAKASGTKEGAAVEFVSISSDNAAVASASIDAKGNVTVKCKAAGTAKLTIRANYKGGEDALAGMAELRVTVKGKLGLFLDKTSLSLFTQTSADIVAMAANASEKQISVTAVSSDAGIVAVSAQGATVTVTGIGAGTATVTVSCEEGSETASATCTVTVKAHPKEDKSTLLKDAGGRQVYVMEGDQYREAVRADYYTADRFYVKVMLYTGWQTMDGKVYYYTADGVKVTGEQVIQGAKYHFASDGSLVVGDGTMGIDVSKWNGNIDWGAVKNSGVSYVIIRSGYRGSAAGKLIADPKFEANIKGALAVGLKIGIYFFSQAVDEVEAVEEASMVLEQIKGYTISYPVFLDVEASGGRGDKIDSAVRTAVCKAFCQTIQKEGYTAGVYSNKTWLETKLDPGALSAYKIWLAQYVAAPTYQGRYDLWQYRATGSIGGISGNVDMNISYLGY